ncbi:carboxymuconolactone decarboxylase family protein [Phenylobacterium sp. LjRoot219]|uniref:carboxymuconolactone decarboxylase family protein n=1 Tax=Phenylobacterium sp. LjRoot219 TaxID=3342283 RepID=UPI003ED15178
MSSNARVPPLPPSEWGEAERAAYGVLASETTQALGASSNMTMVLANHPRLSKAYYTLGRHLLMESTLPDRPRELASLRVNVLTQCEYEWHHHVRFAKRIGLTDAEIEAVKEGPEAALWSEEDRAVLRLVDQQLQTWKVDDATWAELGRFFERRQLMDLAFTIGLYAMAAGAVAALGIEIEPGFESREHSLTSGPR